MFKFILPLIVFIVISVFLAIGLGLNPREIPSPLIDKPAPEFSLPNLHNPKQILTNADFKGQVWLLNVWASWCVSCRSEHPVLNQLAQKKQVPIIGLNYKDDPAAAQSWLQQLGNPYSLSLVDMEGEAGIDWGVYGVPETFVIDKHGLVRHKFTGPVTVKAIQEILLPLVKKLQAES